MDLDEKRPSVVWVLDPRATKKNQAVEDAFADERIVLALRRFHCLRAETKSLPDAREQRKLCKRVPLLFFYDPAGKLIDVLEGRRATSGSGIERRVRQLWATSYVTRLRNYLVRMDELLDRTVKLDRLQADLESKKKRWKDRPNRLRVLEKKEKELQALRRKVEFEQRKTEASCRLREKYLPPETEKEAE